MAFLPSCCKCGLRFSFRGRTKSEGQTPLLLLCGHVFCYSCLKKDLTYSSRAIVCFKCETKTILEEPGSLKYLEQDIFCLGLSLLYQNSRVLDIINSKTWKFCPKPSKSISSTPTIKDICTECNEKEAQCLCDRCDVLMCNPCFTKVHSTSNVLKRHRAVDLSDFPRESPFINNSVKKCSLHSKPCDFFCEDDDQSLCSDCLTSHKRHNILTTKNKKNHQLEFVRNLEKTANANLALSKSTKKKLDAFLQKIGVERKETLVDVQRRFHFFHCLLQCKEKILKDKVNSTFSEMANTLNDKVQCLMESIEDAESNLIVVQEAINNSNPMNLNCEKISEVLKSVIGTLSSDESFGGDLNISSSLKEESNLMKAISVLDFCCNEILPEIKNAVIKKSETEPKIINDDKCEISNSAAETLECRDDDSDIDEPPMKTKGKFQSISFRRGRKCVRVTHIASPSDFYVRSVYESKRLESLTKEFNSWCNALIGDSKSDCHPCMPNKGDLVFGKFGEDNVWYRARITNIDTDADAVDLLYIDYGNMETVSFDRIFAIPEKYQKIPVFAIHCCLAHIVPVHDEWNAEDIQAFSKLSTNKPMQLSVLMEMKDSPSLVDLGDSEISSVCDSLVFLGHASFANSHEASLMKASNKYPQTIQYPSSLMPKENLFTAAITFVCSPGRFFVQEVPCDKMDGELDLMDQRFTYSNKVNQLNAFIDPSIGEACVAKYSEDGLWYRGEILEVIDPGQVVVKYVDFGNDETLSIWDIRKINEDLINVPAKALECCLADVVPVSNRDNQWSNEAVDFLKQLAGKMIEVIVKEVLEVGVLSVYVKADCAASTVNTALVDFGWAKFNLPGFYGMHTQTEGSGTGKSPCSLKIPYGEPVKLEIIKATSPSEFYIQLPLQKIMFQKLCDDIQKYVDVSSQSASSSSSSSLSSVLEGDTDKLKENWCCGDHCLVWNPNSLVWSRASIVTLNFLDNSAKVCCYDYGSKLETSIFKLKSLPDCFKGPPFSISCHLAGVVPSGDSHKWSQTSIEVFSALIENQNSIFRAIIQEIDGNKESVEAELFFNCDDDDVSCDTIQQIACASQYLRDKGLALPMRIKKNQNVIKEIGKGDDVISGYPQLVPHGSEMHLCFTHISDEGIIYGQEWSPGVLDKTKMLLEVNERYEHSQPMSSKLWKQGELASCKFHKDGFYYRARVLKVDGTSQMAQIVFVDYGNLEDVSFSELRPPMFLNAPVSCHACELKGVEWIKLKEQLPHCSRKYVEEVLQKSLNFTISISEYLEDLKRIVGDIFLQGGRPLKDLLLEAGIVKPFEKVLAQKMDNSFTSASESTSDDSDVIVLEEEFNHCILNPNEGVDEDTSDKYFAASPKGPEHDAFNSYPRLNSNHSPQSSHFCISQKLFEDTDNNKESCKYEKSLKICGYLLPFKNSCALNALLPEIGWTIHGVVVAVNSLDEVFVQMCSSKNDIEFSKKCKARLELLSEMTAYYQNSLEDCSTIDMKCLARGLSCLAKCSIDNKWHRAKILDLVLGDNTFSAEIVFVDYGYSNRLSELDKIRALPKDHLQVPNMAVMCHFERADDKNGDLSFLLGKTISLVVKDIREKSLVEISVGDWNILPSHIFDKQTVNFNR